jgi:hypothetical protein
MISPWNQNNQSLFGALSGVVQYARSISGHLCESDAVKLTKSNKLIVGTLPSRSSKLAQMKARVTSLHRDTGSPLRILREQCKYHSPKNLMRLVLAGHIAIAMLCDISPGFASIKFPSPRMPRKPKSVERRKPKTLLACLVTRPSSPH